MNRPAMASISYPPCPNSTPDKCAFLDLGCSKTMMHSPLVLNRGGEAVGGGSNSITSVVKCTQCGVGWYSKQTEFADATGVERKWEVVR